MYNEDNHINDMLKDLILNPGWPVIRELWTRHSRHNMVFSEWLNLLGHYSEDLHSPSQLCFLPISFFKSHPLQMGSFEPEAIFRSSGTRGQVRSRHYIKSLSDYHSSCLESFEFHFGPVRHYRHLFFLPFYRKNPHSSLLNMAEHFIEISRHHGSRYIDHIDDIQNALDESQIQTMLWTVTYGAMDMLDTEREYKHPHWHFIETGGSKGQREVLPRRELHQALKAVAPGAQICSEYGMCELHHQAYFVNGRFECPPGLFVCCTDIRDPLHILPMGQRGRLCFIDLGNDSSMPFIETEDVGVAYGLHSFTIEGRLDEAEWRGCNLMYEAPN